MVIKPSHIFDNSSSVQDEDFFGPKIGISKPSWFGGIAPSRDESLNLPNFPHFFILQDSLVGVQLRQSDDRKIHPQ